MQQCSCCTVSNVPAVPMQECPGVCSGKCLLGCTRQRCSTIPLQRAVLHNVGENVHIDDLHETMDSYAEVLHSAVFSPLGQDLRQAQGRSSLLETLRRAVTLELVIDVKGKKERK